MRYFSTPGEVSVIVAAVALVLFLMLGVLYFLYKRNTREQEELESNPDYGKHDDDDVEYQDSAIVDQIVEVDAELMSLYLDHGEISPEQLHDAFDKALREGHLIPVCFTSASVGTGVKDLLDIIE